MEPRGGRSAWGCDCRKARTLRCPAARPRLALGDEGMRCIAQRRLRTVPALHPARDGGGSDATAGLSISAHCDRTATLRAAGAAGRKRLTARMTRAHRQPAGCERRGRQRVSRMAQAAARHSTGPSPPTRGHAWHESPLCETESGWLRAPGPAAGVGCGWLPRDSRGLLGAPGPPHRRRLARAGHGAPQFRVEVLAPGSRGGR